MPLTILLLDVSLCNSCALNMKFSFDIAAAWRLLGIDVPMAVNLIQDQFSSKLFLTYQISWRYEIFVSNSRRPGLCVFWGVGKFNVTNVRGDRWGLTKPGKYGVDWWETGAKITTHPSNWRLLPLKQVGKGFRRKRVFYQIIAFAKVSFFLCVIWLFNINLLKYCFSA